jgi:CRP-like cAMP-binding protein
MLTAAKEANALVNLFHQGTKLTFKKGDFVIRPGESPPGVFYISNGLVKAYDITKYGEENLLVIRKKGEVLGLTRTIMNRDRHVVYAALEPTSVFYITRKQFVNFLQANPSAALPLVDMLVEMYLLSSERIMNLEYRTVRERLVSFLISMSHRFGTKTEEGVVLDAPLRHQDIASSISATRETTSRELAVLERHGLIAQNRHSIIVLKDLEKLRRYLE